MNHGHPWKTSDRTGGPIDDVFDQLRKLVPGLIVERLQVTHTHTPTHPADDNNVYFRLPD